jgi:hypothetical protein
MQEKKTNTQHIHTHTHTQTYLVHIGRPEHQQVTTAATARPRQQLRDQVAEHHACARLNVLQREVLGFGAAVHFEARQFAKERADDLGSRACALKVAVTTAAKWMGERDRDTDIDS